MKRLPNGLYSKADVVNKSRTTRSKGTRETYLELTDYGRSAHLVRIFHDGSRETIPYEIGAGWIIKDGMETLRVANIVETDYSSFKSRIVLKLRPSASGSFVESFRKLHRFRKVNQCMYSALQKDEETGWYSVWNLTPLAYENLMQARLNAHWIDELNELRSTLPGNGDIKHIARKKGKPRTRWHAKLSKTKGYYNGTREPDYKIRSCGGEIYSIKP